jgi:ribonuclease P protein subunit RPR2
MNRSKKDPSQRRLGLERMERLFELAGKEFGSHPERAHRNVQLARKIAMRYNIRMPARLKRNFCRKCYKYLSPNINCKVSKRHGLLTIKCMECGELMKMSEGGK